jgi:general secretion pathway protein N
MRWPAAVILGVVSYLFFLAYSLPAQLLIGWIGGGGSAQSLTIEGVSGSLWSGKARQVFYQRTPLGELAWDFHPTSLLLGDLACGFELKDTGQQLQGTFVSGFGESYRLENVDALLMASRLPEFLRKRKISLAGKVRAQELDLAFSNGRLTEAKGRVQWLEGALQSPMNMTIGDLQADLSMDEASGDILGKIRDLKGPISVQAEVRLKSDGNLQFNGKLKPGDGADPGLSGALQMVGRPQPDGSVQLTYAGKI